MKISSSYPFSRNQAPPSNSDAGQVKARGGYDKATDEVAATAGRDDASITAPPPAAWGPQGGQLQLTGLRRSSQQESHYVYGVYRAENMALRAQTALRSYRDHAELHDDGMAELLPRLDAYA